MTTRKSSTTTRKPSPTQRKSTVTRSKTTTKPKSKASGGTLNAAANSQDELRRKLIDRGMTDKQATAFAKNAKKRSTASKKASTKKR